MDQSDCVIISLAIYHISLVVAIQNFIRVLGGGG